MARTRDMTAGSPTKHLILFTLPIIAGNAFQQLYSLVDSFVVGQVSVDALTAVASAGWLDWLVLSLAVGLAQGFGIQVMYNDDLTMRESYIVKDGDSIAIKEGYHPVAAAPGYCVYYLWVMAGTSGRRLTPCDDPNHAWVKAVEQMV